MTFIQFRTQAAYVTQKAELGARNFELETRGALISAELTSVLVLSPGDGESEKKSSNE